MAFFDRVFHPHHSQADHQIRVPGRQYVPEDSQHPGPGAAESETQYVSEETVSREALPEWTPSTAEWHVMGKFNEASGDECLNGKRFCKRYPLQPPRLLPSDIVDRIHIEGCAAWGMRAPVGWDMYGEVQKEEKSRKGVTRVRSVAECPDTCLLSDLPLIAGLYDTHGKEGVYYEVSIIELDSDHDGVVAIGTACQPYPPFRLPGWNRLSAGLHSDDLRIFFEDPFGGRDFPTNGIFPTNGSLSPGDVVGCGYEFSSCSLFYTYNGIRLPPAFRGIYTPRSHFDVYAAVGVSGRAEVEVNFGASLFRWKQGNEWAWRVEGHVGSLNGLSGSGMEELPSYGSVARRR